MPSRTFLFILAALIAVALFLFVSVKMMPGAKPKIVIQWGMVDEIAEGAEVFIDGELAGTLRMQGRATRTVFLVERGAHEIQIRGTEIECLPARVDAPLRAQMVQLVLDYESFADENGNYTEKLVLR